MRCSVYFLTLIGITAVAGRATIAIPRIKVWRCPDYKNAKSLYEISAVYQKEVELKEKLITDSPNEDICTTLKKDLSQSIAIWKHVCDAIKSYNPDGCPLSSHRPALNTTSCDYLAANLEELQAKFPLNRIVPRHHALREIAVPKLALPSQKLSEF